MKLKTLIINMCNIPKETLIPEKVKANYERIKNGLAQIKNKLTNSDGICI